MSEPIQKRAIATRSKLLDAAHLIVRSEGFGAMRVEQVVKDAGVAKGTFFAHFPDKDAVMDIIIGARIDALLDEVEAAPAPADMQAVITRLLPLMRFMSSERYVFDVIIRYSGAAAKEEIGPIAQTFMRQIEIFAPWLAQGPFRKDVAPELLAEGVQALLIQCIALNFCAINSAEKMEARLATYLHAWLMPVS